MAEKETLQDILVSDLPPAFVSELKQRLSQVYKESLAKACNDPSFDESGAKYIYGHFRHVLSNRMFRQLAAKHGLTVSLEKTHTDSTDFTVVSIGRLLLTISHVKNPKAIPDRAHHREQYSKINGHLPQMDFFEDCYIENNENLYAIICHGGSTEKGSQNLGFVGFSFTNQQGNCVLDHIPIDDISEIQYIQAMGDDEREEQLATVQNTDPILKTHKKRDKEAS